MVKALVIFLFIASAAILLRFQPWQPRRYDSTPAGQAAKRTDNHVQQAFDWTPPDKRDVIEEIGPTENPKILYHGYIGMSFGDAHRMYDALKKAGATEVVYINIMRRVKLGTHAEGAVAVLPKDKTARAAVFTAFKPWFSQCGQTLPPDVNQKYLYLHLNGDWSPDQPETRFLGTDSKE